MALRLFVINLNYTAPIEKIDEYLTDHRDYLDLLYKSGQFLASGPKEPRIGGIILAKATNKEELDAIMKKDPFTMGNLATYEIVEFVAVKLAPALQDFLESKSAS